MTELTMPERIARALARQFNRTGHGTLPNDIADRVEKQWVSWLPFADAVLAEMEPTHLAMTVSEWQDKDKTDWATPLCPHCRMHLGVRSGLWTDSGRDVWLCDKCGEFDRA